MPIVSRAVKTLIQGLVDGKKGDESHEHGMSVVFCPVYEAVGELPDRAPFLFRVRAGDESWRFAKERVWERTI